MHQKCECAQYDEADCNYFTLCTLSSGSKAKSVFFSVTLIRISYSKQISDFLFSFFHRTHSLVFIVSLRVSIFIVLIFFSLCFFCWLGFSIFFIQHWCLVFASLKFCLLSLLWSTSSNVSVWTVLLVSCCVFVVALQKCCRKLCGNNDSSIYRHRYCRLSDSSAKMLYYMRLSN